MFQARVDLIFEFLAVDGGTAPAGSRGVAALDHKVFDDSMEDGGVVVPAVGESGKVFARFGGVIGVEF